MSDSEKLSDFVYTKLAELGVDSPQSKAALAILRRGVGKDLADAPDTWTYVLADLPDELEGKYNNGVTAASKGEMAVYATLTLYALHRQGNPSSVNIKGKSFGTSFGELSRSSPNSDGITRRFNSIVSASDINELLYHLRGAVQLMASNSPVVGMDYCRLAKDLYFYQYPKYSKNVVLSWGRDFYRTDKNDFKENKVSD